MIITDINKLKNVCETVSLLESTTIIEKLEQELQNSKNPGIGLAAPQIGINKRVCIIRSQNKIDLVNPKIIEQYDLMEFVDEGCLSFPYQWVTTKRYNEIFIQDSLHPAGLILVGIDAVIAQHECLGRNSIIHTEDGPMKIKYIVEKKYNGKVLSMDDNNNLVYSNIIGWNKKKNKEKKKWVRLKSSQTGLNKQLICTEDHRCAIIEDIFKPKIKYLEAKNLDGKYLVRRTSVRKTNSENPLYNSEQLSIIFGGLLGDFCVSGYGEITANHGDNQFKYAKFKAKILGGKLSKVYSGYKNEYSNHKITVPINEQTKEIRKIIYTPNKKVENIIPFINEISLAFWFMDDGCCIYRRRGKNRKGERYFYSAQFHTESFSENDIELLINILSTKFNLISRKSQRKLKSGIKYIICLNKKSSIKLMNMISKYIPECMEYKIPEEYRNNKKYNFDSKHIDFSCKKITKIFYLKKYESCLYDITVEKTHNYFADDSLVHNCGHLNGKTMYDYQIERPNRNEKCWCNSGKKYKKCHMNKIIR